jgi:flagellar hook-associated protein 1 FlgK
MSLFSILSLSSNALNANQLGLRTVANNIANAQTEGYIRQDLILTTAPAQRMGQSEVGTGVKVVGVQQQINELVAERLRHAKGDLAGASAHEEVFRELEALLGELEDSDLSSGLSRFFGSLHDVVNQPDSVAVRNVAVLEASQLSLDIRRHDTRFREIRSKVNNEIGDAVADVNRLLNEVADLNRRISQSEGSLPIEKGAVGLRDQRQLALAKLSELLDIRTTEQPSGAVTVHSNGEFLVFDGVARQLEVSLQADRGIQLNQVRIADTQAPVNTSSGRIGGLIAARDQTLGGVIDRFDDIARSLIYEFNQVFTSGQGLEGYTDLQAEHRVMDSGVALDAAGLPFEPGSGTFKVVTWNREQNQQVTHEIVVRLNGLDDDTTLEDVRAALDQIDGLVAEWGDDGKLRVATDRPGLEFAFSDDTSGVVAALGMATFFQGYSAGTIDVSEAVRSSPGKFASSSSGFGRDSDIALRLAELADLPLDSQGGSSLSESYEMFTIGITQDAAAASAITEGAAVFHNTIEAEHLSVIGVSLDEEAVKMLAYQRAFQASARVIQTANSLLELLVSL